MYKNHLRRWGIHKYLRATQVQEYLQKVPIMDEARSEVFIGGVKADRKRLQTYIRRAAMSRGGGTALIDSIGLRTPSPENMFIHSFKPEFENMIHAMRDFVRGSLSSGRWTESQIPWKNDLMISVHNGMWMAGRLMSSGHLEQAFRMVNMCLNRCKDVLKFDSPFFIRGRYGLWFKFSNYGAVAKSFMSFVRDLALVTLKSKQHPMYILCDILSRMTAQQMRDYAWALEERYHTVMSKEVGPSRAFAGELEATYGRYVSWVAAYAPVGDRTAEQALREHAQAFCARDRTSFEALEAKLRLANFFLDRRRYGEAKIVAEEVLSLAACRETGSEHAYLFDDCYRILFWVSRSGSSHGETVAAAGRWVGYCTERLGRSHELTVDALGEVAEYLKNDAGGEAASEACRDYEVAIDDMCKQLERVGLQADRCVPHKRTMLYGRMAQRIGYPGVFHESKK